MGQALAQEGPRGTEGGLVAGGGSPELCFLAAVLLQPPSPLRALLSQGRQDTLPAPRLYAGAEPGGRWCGARRVRGCSDPRAGTRAGLQPLMDQGSDPPSSRCCTTLAAVSHPSPTPAGLFLAATGRVVPHGRKRCLTGVNSDSNPGGVPCFPSSPGARGWAACGCACSGSPALPSGGLCAGKGARHLSRNDWGK